MNYPPKRIAIVRLSALGDIINSAVVLQFIHAHLPDAKIEWFVEAPFAAILEPHPLLHAVHPVPLKRIKQQKSLSLLRETVKKLKSLGPYDLVIDMQGLLKSAVVSRLLGNNVHGFDRHSAREGIAALFYRSASAIPYAANIIRRNCGLVGDALRFHIDETALLNKVPTLYRSLQRPEILDACPEKYIAVVVGASWPSKCYPPERLTRVCSLLPLPCVLLWGSGKEKDDALKISANCLNTIVSPPLNLPQLRDAVAFAELTVGGDTGPTHLAWAFNRPSVTLYGPTTPRMMFETPINVAVESDSKVDILKIDKSDMSIGTIPPEVIAERIKELL